MSQLVLLTPTLNAGAMIGNLVANINALAEKWDVVQYVGDGGSTDNTLSILADQARYRKHVHTLPRMNIPDTLNQLASLALKQHDAQTPFTVLNADDLLYPDVLAEYLDVYHTHCAGPTGALLAGTVDVVADGRTLGQRLSTSVGLKDYMSVNHLGLLAPLSVWETCPFPDSPTAYDYIWLRMLLRGDPELRLQVWNKRAIGCAEFGGLSYRKRYAAQKEILRDDLAHSNAVGGTDT